MDCGSTPINSSPPPRVSSPGGAAAAPAATTQTPAPPALASTSSSAPAADAVAGASGGGSVGSQGAAGGALAGATGAVAPDQLVAQLQDIIGKINALVQQLQTTISAGTASAAGPSAAVAGGGAAGSGPAMGSCCGGASDAAAGASQVSDRARFDDPTQRTGGAAGAPMQRALKFDATSAPAPRSAPSHGTDGIGSEADKARIAKYVQGDTHGLNPQLLSKLAQVGEHVGRPLKIDSGFRSREEQQKLYARYLAGTGNLAARPGTSNHESGNAADISIGGTSLRDDAKAADYARSIGLAFPIPSESWHTELAK